MNKHRLHSLSLQDLSVFIAVTELGSVGNAAKAHGISQPSASYALDKMRRVYDDELLIRSGGVMRLTALGQSIVDKGKPVLADFLEVRPALQFDPTTSTRNFTVIGFSSHLLGPYKRLIDVLKQRAPNITFSYHYARWDSINDQLMDEADLYLGIALPEHPETQSKPLAAYSVVLCYDAESRPPPRTVEDVVNAEYVQLRSGSPHSNNIVDAWLIKNGYSPREFRYTVSDSAVLSEIVRGTDILISASTLVHEDIFSDLAAVPFPADLGDLPYELRWSRHRDKDPALLWLIDLITELAND